MRAVVDASGTWATPNPLGADGLPALGERAAADRISYRVPDLRDPAVRARYASKRTAVVGSGASAFTALVDLAQDAPSTHAVWVLRRGLTGSTFPALTDYEQVRSVAAHLAGDHEAAARVELTLPETGVCGGALAESGQTVGAQEPEGGCFGAPAAPQLITLGVPSAGGSCSSEGGC